MTHPFERQLQGGLTEIGQFTPAVRFCRPYRPTLWPVNTVPNTATLDYAKANQADLYNAYIDSPITNTHSNVLVAGFFMEDVGEATLLYDQIWTEVKGEE